ncbi:MAG: hypothetical protein ACI8XM_002609 [Haloarculaceae archaeon]|jgi:hypothetical protein
MGTANSINSSVDQYNPDRELLGTLLGGDVEQLAMHGQSRGERDRRALEGC